ncbi:glutamyl-tRNA reductase [Ilumatobacter fluminis]|uniref:Glutamyl-tRNA reductase n=1 Tax=Ilumatobacter fluminis TaxID=467091 RepID=A0A4R7HVX4_9ACTN|nr:glutamyl-tRNA reductase [Ilumatobacter fluminis]TDT15152.1 glutamyl-tRNA reductase [Ilumatobacter fluminis]
MSILVLGINHRSGPLSLLERVSLADTEVPKSVEALVQRDNVREAVVISTCNRTEVYAVTERFHGAYADIRDFFCDQAHVAADDLHEHLYSHHDDQAVRHLFEVASGLDSAVIGESEILGQLRGAWDVAQHNGGSRTTLNLLFRHAIEVGKRVRTDTAIGRGTASVSHAAVEMAVDRLGDLHGRNVAVVGAGAMGEGIAVALHAAGVGEVVVINRSPERGQALAERINGVAFGFERLAETLASADVVLTSTGAGGHIITADNAGLRDRAERPVLVVDIAVPRDVAPDVADLDGVSVLDLDDLTAWAEKGRQQRIAEVAAVERIIEGEVERFSLEAASLQAAPLISSMRRRADEVRAAELDRHAARLDRLDDETRELVEQISRGVVAKLLHEPSVRLRQQAGTPQGERNAAAVADLFDLG